MRSYVVILCIEHNAQNVCLLKECYCFAHQTHTDPLTVHRWMDSNAYKIAKFILKCIELITDYFAVQFSHDKVRVSRNNILERKRIISPEVLETCLLDGKQGGYISFLDRSQFYVGVSCRGNTVVIFIVGIK